MSGLVAAALQLHGSIPPHRGTILKALFRTLTHGRLFRHPQRCEAVKADGPQPMFDACRHQHEGNRVMSHALCRATFVVAVAGLALTTPVVRVSVDYARPVIAAMQRLQNALATAPRWGSAVDRWSAQSRSHGLVRQVPSA